MSRSIKIISVIGCLLTSLLQGVYAQAGKDEQGLYIPDNLQLQQDRAALEEAHEGWWTSSFENYSGRMSWYNDAKFGCFIHWGVYSAMAGVWNGELLGGYTEHLMRKACIPLEEYKKKVVSVFNPSEFDADEWMRQVAMSGMKYFIITAKHHDGFAMYPSEAYPYDIRMTRFGKDPMALLREAAKKYGIKFGFYYSHAFDWEHPDAPGNDWDYDNPGGDKLLGGADWWLGERRAFLQNAEKYVKEKSIPQIQELIRKYDPDILWFDTPAKLPLYLNLRILKAIREIDVHNKIVVNGRLVRFGTQNLGDYRNMGDRAAFFFPVDGPWESIPTTNESYGYSVVDTIRKPSSFFIRLLASAASKGGNILMNVGPMGNGKWDKKDVDIFLGVGRWLEKNGESIYGAQRTDLPVQPWGVTTWKNDTLYAHVFRWPDDGKLVIGGLRSKVSSGYLLADRKQVVKGHRLNSNDYELVLPTEAPDSVNSVIVLAMRNRVASDSVRLLSTKQTNVIATFDALLHGKGWRYGDGKPNRNHVKNWKDASQSISWNLRLNEPVEYQVYLDYNTTGEEDAGTVVVEIAEKEFEVKYPAFIEKRGTNTLPVGRIRLEQGILQCRLRGKSYYGKAYMNPICLRMVPVSADL